MKLRVTFKTDSYYRFFFKQWIQIFLYTLLIIRNLTSSSNHVLNYLFTYLFWTVITIGFHLFLETFICFFSHKYSKYFIFLLHALKRCNFTFLNFHRRHRRLPNWCGCPPQDNLPTRKWTWWQSSLPIRETDNR